MYQTSRIIFLVIVLVQSNLIYSADPNSSPQVTTRELDGIGKQPPQVISSGDTISTNHENKGPGLAHVDKLASPKTADATGLKDKQFKQAEATVEKTAHTVEQFAEAAMKRAEKAMSEATDTEVNLGVHGTKAEISMKRQFVDSSEAIEHAIDQNGNSLESSNVQKVIDQARNFTAPEDPNLTKSTHPQATSLSSPSVKQIIEQKESITTDQPNQPSRGDKKLHAVDKQLQFVHRQTQKTSNPNATFTLPPDLDPTTNMLVVVSDLDHHNAKTVQAQTPLSLPAAVTSSHATVKSIVKTRHTPQQNKVLSPAPTPEDEHPDLDEPTPDLPSPRQSIHKASSGVLPWLMLGILCVVVVGGTIVYLRLPTVGVAPDV